MSPLLLVGLLALQTCLADVKHVLEGLAHPPEQNTINSQAQAINFLAHAPGGNAQSKAEFWWMQPNSPFGEAYNQYKLCQLKGNCSPKTQAECSGNKCSVKVNHQAVLPLAGARSNIDINKNIFFNGQFQSGFPSAPVGVLPNNANSNINVRNNPFLNGQFSSGFPVTGNGKTVSSVDGHIGVQPSKPFNSKSDKPLEQPSSKVHPDLVHEIDNHPDKKPFATNLPDSQSRSVENHSNKKPFATQHPLSSNVDSSSSFENHINKKPFATQHPDSVVPVAVVQGEGHVNKKPFATVHPDSVDHNKVNAGDGNKKPFATQHPDSVVPVAVVQGEGHVNKKPFATVHPDSVDHNKVNAGDGNKKPFATQHPDSVVQQLGSVVPVAVVLGEGQYDEKPLATSQPNPVDSSNNYKKPLSTEHPDSVVPVAVVQGEGHENKAPHATKHIDSVTSAPVIPVAVVPDESYVVHSTAGDGDKITFPTDHSDSVVPVAVVQGEGPIAPRISNDESSNVEMDFELPGQNKNGKCGNGYTCVLKELCVNGVIKQQGLIQVRSDVMLRDNTITMKLRNEKYRSEASFDDEFFQVALHVAYSGENTNVSRSFLITYIDLFGSMIIVKEFKLQWV